MQLLQLQNNSGIQLNEGKLAVNKPMLEMRRMHMRSEAIRKSSEGSRKQPHSRLVWRSVNNFSEEVMWQPMIKNSVEISDSITPSTLSF